MFYVCLLTYFDVCCGFAGMVLVVSVFVFVLLLLCLCCWLFAVVAPIGLVMLFASCWWIWLTFFYSLCFLLFLWLFVI